MAIIIEATIVSGLRAATMTVRLQMPLLVINHFPEIRDCRPATINLQLDRPLRVNNPTFTTPPIPWIPNRPELSETFSFLRIQLECPIGAEPQGAWIYIPHASPHRHNLFSAEILAKQMDAVQINSRCKLHIANQHSSSEVLIV